MTDPNAVNRTRGLSRDLQLRRKELVAQLHDLGAALSQELSPFDFWANSDTVSLDPDHPQESHVGFLSARDGEMQFLTRSELDGYHDAVAGIPEEWQAWHRRNLDDPESVPLSWLRTVATPECLSSLFADAEAKIREAHSDLGEAARHVSDLWRPLHAAIIEDVGKSASSSELTEIASQTASIYLLAASEPKRAITLATTLVERVTRNVIERAGGEVPSAPNVTKLVKEALRCLRPSSEDSRDDPFITIARQLNGLASGLGGARNSASDAHAGDPEHDDPRERHAALHVTAACALVQFMLDSIAAREAEGVVDAGGTETQVDA